MGGPEPAAPSCNVHRSHALPLLCLASLPLLVLPFAACFPFWPSFSVPWMLGGRRAPSRLCPTVRVPGGLPEATLAAGPVCAYCPSAQARPGPRPDTARKQGLWPACVLCQQEGRRRPELPLAGGGTGRLRFTLGQVASLYCAGGALGRLWRSANATSFPNISSWLSPDLEDGGGWRISESAR